LRRRCLSSSAILSSRAASFAPVGVEAPATSLPPFNGPAELIIPSTAADMAGLPRFSSLSRAQDPWPQILGPKSLAPNPWPLSLGPRSRPRRPNPGLRILDRAGFLIVVEWAWDRD